MRETWAGVLFLDLRSDYVRLRRSWVMSCSIFRLFHLISTPENTEIQKMRNIKGRICIKGVSVSLVSAIWARGILPCGRPVPRVMMAAGTLTVLRRRYC